MISLHRKAPSIEGIHGGLISTIGRSVAVRGICILLCALFAGCVSSGDRPLQLIKGADPQYPAAALKQGIEGFVTLSYRVSQNGDVENVQVVESNPAGVFDTAAIAAVQQWRYNAPRRQGETVAAPRVTSTLEFKLADAEAAAKYEGL